MFTNLYISNNLIHSFALNSFNLDTMLYLQYSRYIKIMSYESKLSINLYEIEVLARKYLNKHLQTS